jgi:hypothetical protein
MHNAFLVCRRERLGQCTGNLDDSLERKACR